MLFNLYSLKDKLMGVYLTPFTARGDVDACRQISNAIKDPQMANQALVTNPSDYEIVSCGVFDDESGTIHSQTPTVIKQVSDLARELRTVTP